MSNSDPLDDRWFPDEGLGVFALLPPAVSPRVTRQGSVLTVHAAPDLDERFIPLEKRPEAKGVLSRAVVPAHAKRQILDDLGVLGVDRYSLFPDLDGLGGWLADLHSADVLAQAAAEESPGQRETTE